MLYNNDPTSDGEVQEFGFVGWLVEAGPSYLVRTGILIRTN